MANERSLVLVKPDAMQRGLAGAVLQRLENRGLLLIGLKLMRVDQDLASRHYAEHEGKPFFAALVDYITSSPIIAAVFEGDSATSAIRNSVGVTNPSQAAAGTIRGDFGLEVGRNLVHASDSPESGERELALFFTQEELVQWSRDNERWISENP
ncbi:MAG: nucleoside-diphosphate kinase [Dehalococcoidia bacterium]|nr:nucleoside-diphosphate kinase [Dehalococcoidia bacterium]HCV00321.1 nucleoside-diphosphate kinase [Dehalococcoidia bacterium]|tara:strand:+ start:140 stop:601 length:462 start_codon:yes stop_codon:yes gene_type:complete